MRPLKITGIIAGVLAAAVFIFFLVLSLINSSRSERWLQNPQVPGKLVDIGGNKLYCTIRGEKGPSVIIESDIGSSSPEWWHIQNELSKCCRVLTYDRAGYGWSGPDTGPRSSGRIIEDLGKLLKKTDLPGPYILVGHGLGALYLQHFAKKNPGKVKGMVLVKPYSVSYFRLKTELERVIFSNLIDKTPSYKITRFLAKAGIIRFFQATPYVSLPDDIKQLVVENYSRPELYAAMINEYRESLETSIDEVKKAGPMPGVPITVIGHSPKLFMKELMTYTLSWDEADHIDSIWNDMYDEIAKSSPRGRVIRAAKSTHNMHIDEPELLVTAVKEILGR